MRSTAATISAKHRATRSEAIRAVPGDGSAQLGVSDGAYDNVHIASERLLKDALDAAKVEQMQANSLGRRDEDVDIAPRVAFSACQGAEDRRMRNSPRRERRAQTAENIQGALTIHLASIE